MKFLKYRYDLIMFQKEVLVSLYSLVLSVSNKVPFYLLPDFEVPYFHLLLVMVSL